MKRYYQDEISGNFEMTFFGKFEEYFFTHWWTYLAFMLIVCSIGSALIYNIFKLFIVGC